MTSENDRSSMIEPARITSLMEAFLTAWLPRHLLTASFQIVTFQGKDDHLGKLEAPNIPASASYRTPDGILGGSWEAFERVMQRSGYFKSGLEKVRAAREIGAHVDAAQSLSQSFNYLVRVLGEAVA